ncbi:MAG: FAD-dependent monooxygenase [Hyphomonadaceae bacterium]|nr:FAD-dependent monooxygenase [Hyphomonadaceae bacterium]
MRRLSIGIAGCGVAGLAAGALLAREGHRVTLFERAPAPAPVGSGLILQPLGLAVLGELGARAQIETLGARVRRLFGRSAPSGRIVLDVRYAAIGAEAYGLSVHRAALFDVLLKAGRAAGLDIVSGRTVIGAEDGWLAFEDGRRARFDLAIDALGAGSRLSPRAPLLTYGALWASLNWTEGFADDALEQRYERARRMVGVLPIGRIAAGGAQQAAFFWSLKHADFEAWRAAPLEAWKEEVLRLWPETAPLVAQVRSHEDLIMARYAHRTVREPIGRGFVRVGDAWHCTSPQLGQGANFALLDALALSRALATRSDLAAALEDYVLMREWHVRLYQLASFLFTPAYQSDSVVLPWLRDGLVGPVSRIWPAPKLLASLVAGMWGGPLGAIGGCALEGPTRLS